MTNENARKDLDALLERLRLEQTIEDMQAEIEGRTQSTSQASVDRAIARVRASLDRFARGEPVGKAETVAPGASSVHQAPINGAETGNEQGAVRKLISVMLDTTAALFPDPNTAPPVAGSAHTPIRSGSETKAPVDWQLVGKVPSVQSDGVTFELWESGSEREVRILPGSAFGKVVVHQVVMPALVASRDPSAFPVLVKSEKGQNQRLVVEGLKYSRLKNLKEAIEKAHAAGDEAEVERLLPRLELEAK